MSDACKAISSKGYRCLALGYKTDLKIGNQDLSNYTG